LNWSTLESPLSVMGLETVVVEDDPLFKITVSKKRLKT